MSYFRSMEENIADVKKIQTDLDAHATSNTFSGSSSPGSGPTANKAANEEMTSKRTTMKLGTGTLKREKE